MTNVVVFADIGKFISVYDIASLYVIDQSSVGSIFFMSAVSIFRWAQQDILREALAEYSHEA